jgi:hypothetical protein
MSRSEPGPPEYEAGVLTSRPLRSVKLTVSFSSCPTLGHSVSLITKRHSLNEIILTMNTDV